MQIRIQETGVALQDINAVIVDGIQTVGVHNGIARVLFMRLGADGKAAPAVELLIPINQIGAIAQGLSKILK